MVPSETILFCRNREFHCGPCSAQISLTTWKIYKKLLSVCCLLRRVTYDDACRKSQTRSSNGKPTPIRIDGTITGIHADVVVVGTGISGAMVVDALTQAGYSVLALDRREPMSGSTPASTLCCRSNSIHPSLSYHERLASLTPRVPGGGQRKQFEHCRSALMTWISIAALQREVCNLSCREYLWVQSA